MSDFFYPLFNFLFSSSALKFFTLFFLFLFGISLFWIFHKHIALFLRFLRSSFSEASKKEFGISLKKSSFVVLTVLFGLFFIFLGILLLEKNALEIKVLYDSKEVVVENKSIIPVSLKNKILFFEGKNLFFSLENKLIFPGQRLVLSKKEISDFFPYLYKKSQLRIGTK